MDTVMDTRTDQDTVPPYRSGMPRVAQCLAYRTSPRFLGAGRDHELAVTDDAATPEHVPTDGFGPP